MASLPYVIDSESVLLAKNACEKFRSHAQTSPLGVTPYVPPAPFPSLDFDKYTAAVKASPAHKPALLLAAKGKQAPARQRVPICAHQRKVVSLALLHRQQLTRLDEARRQHGIDKEGLTKLFTEDGCVVSGVKTMFVALEAPPGTGKSVQLPIVLSSVDSFKKTRIISVTCFSKDDGVDEETSRAVGAHAAAAKARLFSLETEQFMSAASFETCDAITDVTRVVFTTMEVFISMLVTAVVHQHNLLQSMASGVQPHPSSDPFADVGAISFDHFSEQSFSSQTLTTMLNLLKSYYTLRMQTSISATLSALNADVCNFNVPQCIFACDSTAAVGGLEAFLKDSITSTICGFLVSKEVIPSPNTSLFDGGVLLSDDAFCHEGVSSVITDADLQSGLEKASYSTIPIIAGPVGSIAWLHVSDSSTARLREAMGSVSFRTYQQSVEQGSLSSPHWLIEEAARRVTLDKPVKSLFVLPSAADCSCVMGALNASLPSVKVMCLDAVASLGDFTSETLRKLEDVESDAHLVVLIPAGMLPALGTLLPSRYSTRNSDLKQGDVFDAVLNFAPSLTTGENALIRCCCFSASSFSQRRSFSTLVDFSSLTTLTSAKTSSSKRDVVRAVSILSQTAQLSVLTATALHFGTDVSSVVHRITSSSQWDSSTELLVQQEVVNLSSVERLIHLCGKTPEPFEQSICQGVEDVVANSQRLVGLSPIGLYCIRYALLGSPTLHATSAFGAARHALFQSAFARAEDSATDAVAMAAAMYPLSKGTNTTEDDVGAVLGSPFLTLTEKVTPMRCRGWLSPLCTAWKNSRQAKQSGISDVTSSHSKSSHVQAIIPSGQHVFAQHQIHQQAIMRIYQNYKVGADDTFDIEGDRRVIVPEEGFATLLSPLVSGDTVTSSDSRVAMGLRFVNISLRPRVDYRSLSDTYFPSSIRSVSADIASYLIMVRDLTRNCIVEFLLTNTPQPTLSGFLKPLLATQDQQRLNVTVRTQRTRRGAAEKDVAAPSQTVVITAKVSPFTPLICFTPGLVSSDEVRAAEALSGFKGAPALTATLIARGGRVRSANEGSDQSYAVFRRALGEVYGYALAYCSSGLSALWMAMPSLYLARSPVESARRVSRRQLWAHDQARAIDVSAPINDAEAMMPFTITRKSVAKREDLRLTVQQYLTESTNFGKRHTSFFSLLTRRGEWQTTSALRLLVLHRFALMAAHFATESEDAMVAALNIVMDTDNVTAVASLTEAQFRVWIGVLLAGNDEDTSLYPSNLSIDASNTFESTDAVFDTVSQMIQSDRRLLPVKLGVGLGPLEWGSWCSEDTLLFCRSVQQEYADVISFKRNIDVKEMYSSAPLTDAPQAYVSSEAHTSYGADAFIRALKKVVSRRASMSPQHFAHEASLVAALCQEASPASLSLLSTLRLYRFRIEDLVASHLRLRNAAFVTPDNARDVSAFLRGSALRDRCLKLLSLGGFSSESLSDLPLVTIEDAEKVDGSLRADLATAGSQFSSACEVPKSFVPSTLRLLAFAIGFSGVGSLRSLDKEEAKRNTYFKNPELISHLSRLVAVDSGHTEKGTTGAAPSAAGNVFVGEEPPLSIMDTIIQVARQIAEFCGNDQHERREMEKRLSTQHEFLLDPTTDGAGRPGAVYHAYYLHRLRIAAPSMSWLGDADDEELQRFLEEIESEVKEELAAGNTSLAAGPEDLPSKKHRPEISLMPILNRTNVASREDHDFQLEEQIATMGDTASVPASDFPPVTAAHDFGVPTNQSYPPWGVSTTAVAHGGLPNHEYHQQAQSETALLMSMMAQPSAPINTFTGLLESPALAIGQAPMVEAAPIFDEVPTDPHPLSVAPPPIPVDPTADHKYSVIVFPVPDVAKYQESQRDAGGEVPHINLPNSLAMALGASLDRTVGPTFLIGNVARIDVPSRALEQRAIQLGAFMCLGTKLRIIPNKRIFDNPLLANERGRGRGGFRGRGRGGAHDGGELFDARGRGSARGRGYRGGMGGDAPQFNGASLLPLPAHATSAAAVMINDTIGIADDSD